jgi:hypothetical protein
MKKKCANGGIVKKPMTMQEQLAQVRGKVRPGYQQGGPVYRQGSSFSDNPLSGQLMQGIASPVQGPTPTPAQLQPTQNQSALNGIPAKPVATMGATAIQSGSGAINSLGKADYSTGPRQGGFVNEDGTPRDMRPTGISIADVAKKGQAQISEAQRLPGLSDRQRAIAMAGVANQLDDYGIKTDLNSAIGSSANGLSQRQKLALGQAQFGSDLAADRATARGVAQGSPVNDTIGQYDPNQLIQSQPGMVNRRQRRQQGFAAGGQVFRDGNTFSDRPLMPEPGNHPQRIANPRPMPRPVAAPQPVRIPLPPPEYPQERVRPVPVDSGAPVGTYPGVAGVADAIMNRKVKNADAKDYAAGGMVRFAGKGGPRDGRAEALNPRTQTASSDTPPAGGFQEEAERRRKQMEEAKNYEAGGLITPVNLGQGLYQAIAQPIAEDWRQGNAAIKKVRDQYPTADSLAGINPFVAAAQVANDVAAGNVGGDTAINVAQAVPVIKGLSGMAKMLTKQAGPTIGATKFVIDMPNTVRKNVALTTGQTLGQPANAFAAGGMVRFSGKGGPRDDKIPVKVAGAEINVSNGENAVILPAKTAANPAALQAINGIIQATNDGRQPRQGIASGAGYAQGGIGWLTNPNDLTPEQKRIEAEQRNSAVSANAQEAQGKGLLYRAFNNPNDLTAGQKTAAAGRQDAFALENRGALSNQLAPAPYTPAPAKELYGDDPYSAGDYPYLPVVADSPARQSAPAQVRAIDNASLPAQGIAQAATMPAQQAGSPSGAGAAQRNGLTITQNGAGFDPTKLTMADGYGVASNKAGKTIAAGPSEYVGADGKPTSRWTDTAAYKDAIARNERDKIRLAEMQAVRLGANPQQALQASQGIAQAAQQSGLAQQERQIAIEQAPQQFKQAQQAAIQAQQVQQFAIDKAAREQSLIDAWDKAGTPEQKQAIAGQLKIMRGQQDKEGQFDATKGGQTVDPATGQIIDLPPVIFNKSTGQPVQQAQSAQQAVPPADKRTVGQTYQTPKGPMIWRGNGWEAAR